MKTTAILFLKALTHKDKANREKKKGNEVLAAGKEKGV